MAEKHFDVVIAGDVYCDFIFTGLPRMPTPGEELFATDFDMTPGGVYITAATLNRLGAHVGLFCHLGNDALSHYIISEMEREGLDLALVQRHERPQRFVSVSLSFQDDRSFLSFTDPVPPDPTPAEALSDYAFRHLHVHWLGQLWDQPELVRMARARGASISLDCQCCPEVMARPDVPEKLGLVDVFMPNRSEALEVTGEADPEAALEKLARWAPAAIVKLGGEGLIARRGGERYALPALPVDVVDTTGAGDAFAGGFIYGMLAGMSFEESLRAATVCGGLSATGRGGATRVPTRAELEGWMARDWPEQTTA